MRVDLDQAEAFSAAVRTTALPQLADLFGETPAEFLRQLGNRDPALAQGMAKLPAIQRLAEKVVTNLQRRRTQRNNDAALHRRGLAPLRPFYQATQPPSTPMI